MVKNIPQLLNYIPVKTSANTIQYKTLSPIYIDVIFKNNENYPRNNIYPTSQGLEYPSLLVEMEIISQETDFPYVEGKVSINRESTEKAINVNKYAKVLANLFRNTEGDFNFGLFGNWGRGKTFLMKEIERILKNEDYEFVWFDAWKYKNQPQIWAHFYDTMYSSFFTKRYKEQRKLRNKISYLHYYLKTVTRFNLYTYNYWSLILGLVSLNGILFFENLANFGKISITSMQHIYISIPLSIAGVGLSFKDLFSYSKLKLKKILKYLKLPTHNETLGFQDIIGKDFKRLLLSKCRAPESFFRKWVVIISSGIIPIQVSLLFNKLPIDHFNVFVFLTIFAALAFLMWFYYFLVDLLVSNKYTKVILIIDNLDRCNPSEMLNVIDSIRLLLDEEEIGEILQTVMLVDESKLRYAISNRYAHQIAIQKKNLNNPYRCSVSSREEALVDLSHKVIDMYNSIVDEQIEKLFLSYLRLNSLTKEEIYNINLKIFNEYAKKSGDEYYCDYLLETINNETLFQDYFKSDYGLAQDELFYLRDKNKDLYDKTIKEINIMRDAKFKESLNTKQEKEGKEKTDLSHEKISVSLESIKVDQEKYTTIQEKRYFNISEELVIHDFICKLSKERSIEVNPRLIRAYVIKFMLIRDLLFELNKTQDLTITISMMLSAVKCRNKKDIEAEYHKMKDEWNLNEDAYRIVNQVI